MHLTLNEDHKQLQMQYSSLYEERVRAEARLVDYTVPFPNREGLTVFWAQVTVERQYQALCESWRVELEDKQKQFEQVKAQILGPR